jgi:Reversibly glycosylated polypeptide
VTSQDFFAEVTAALGTAQRPVLGDGLRHLNILDIYGGTPDDLFPRGFPYEYRGRYSRTSANGKASVSAPAFNLGLWTDAFDVNGIDKINGPQWRWPEAHLAIPSIAVAPGALVSVCSMNMQFRRRVTPAVYQLPMHVPVLPNWMIDRYGDIWGGFILKMLVDRAGETLTVGAPMIGHRKAGDMQRNIWQEHIAHMVNLEAIDLFGRAADAVAPADYLTMMCEFTENMAEVSETTHSMLRPYLDHLVPCLRAWCKALA